MMMRGLFVLGAFALVGVSAGAANLIENGDFSRCENGKLPAECRSEDGVRTSLFTEDLTWNRCLKAEVSRGYTNAATKAVNFTGSAFMGAPGKLGVPVEPMKNYDVSVDLKGDGSVPVDVIVSFWKGDCRNWEDRVNVPLGEGKYRPGKDWLTVRGLVRAPEGAKLAAIRLEFSGSTEKNRIKLKIGDAILADNFSITLSRKNLGGSAAGGEVSVPPRKAVSTEDPSLVDDFINLKTTLPSEVRTSFRVTADEESLVFDFQAEEKGEIVAGDAKNVWSGESFEFFLVAEDGRLRHFGFNLGGAQYLKVGGGKNVGGEGWRVAPERTATGWRATVRVPYATAGLSGRPAPGTALKFNVGRTRRQPETFISWARTNGSFADVAAFGSLIVGDWSAAVLREFGEKRVLGSRDDYVKACAEIEAARIKEKFAKFREQKFSVAVLPVCSDYACPFLPEEIFDPTTNIHLVAAVNEIKAMPLAVANLTDRLEDCLVMLETEANEYVGDFGLKGFPAGQVKVRRAVRMRDAAGDAPAMRFDPLMPSDGACAVTVPSHEAALVWFDFDTADVKPGTYVGRLRVIPLAEAGRFVRRPKGGWADRDYVGKMQTIPVTLEVQPIVLPKRAPITGGFYQHVPNEEAYGLAADIGGERHEISPYRFPISGDAPEISARIAMEREWAKRRGIPLRYDIHYSVYTYRCEGLKDPQAADRIWVPYLRNVKRIMNASGVPDEDYWIETADEPKAADLKTLIRAHRQAKEALPTVRLCVTIAAWELPEAELRELAEVTDEFIFWGRSYFTDPQKKRFVADFRARGGTVCHYMCGTSMRLPLDSYFRHHAWIGERYALDGNYLYELSKLVKCFGSTDFKELTAGDILYYAYGKAVPSVRYCAFREGITDVKYLAALRAAAGDDPEAKAFLDQAAKEVLDVSPRDPKTPDRMRERARQLLLKRQPGIQCGCSHEPSVPVAATPVPNAFSRATEGFASKDPLVRRFALNELFEKNPAAAVAQAKTMTADPDEAVQLYLVALSPWIKDQKERTAFVGEILARTTHAAVIREAERRGGFPFFRNNVAKSKDPANDHDLSVIKTIPLPTEGWAFATDLKRSGHLGAVPFQSVDFADASWKRIRIGDVWEKQGFDGYDGIAWYRVTFTLPEKPVGGESCELCFDAVDEEAWVWLNGTYLGQHAEGSVGWDIPFRFSADAELKWGAENTLVVRVGDSTACGGIWKGVRVEVLK